MREGLSGLMGLVLLWPFRDSGLVSHQLGWERLLRMFFLGLYPQAPWSPGPGTEQEEDTVPPRTHPESTGVQG